MSSNRILILTGYDYSSCFEALEGYDFEVLVPKNEALLTSDARLNLKEILGDKLIEVNYCDVGKYVKLQAPDFLITFGWRRIVSDDVIDISKVAINIHPAILPEYKGYHPVPYVLINNETEHGVTAHIIESKLDAGPIIHQEKFAVNKLSTLNELQTRVNLMMPTFLRNLCKIIDNGNYQLLINDDSKTKILAGRRTPQDSEISLDITMNKAYDLIRACDSERFPAYIMIDGQKVLLKLEFNEIS